MTRFFIRPDQITNKEVVLEAGDTHHLRVVLHAKAGDAITVLDGIGNEYDVVMTEVGKSQARGNITGSRMLTSEFPSKITVAQALPKTAEKMEQVLQHGTEIGASSFWAYASARSLTHLTGDRQAKRLVRLGDIMKTAAEQAFRAVVPTLRADQSFAQVVKAASNFDLAIFAFEREKETTLRQKLESLTSKPATILVVVGPEGGFIDQEAALARRHGLSSVTLGPRILRTETAALAILSQIVYALG